MTSGRLGAFFGLSAWMPYIKDAKEAVTTDPPEVHQARMRSLISTCTHILKIEPFTPVTDIEESVTDLPVYLGHGIDDVLINISNCHDLSVTFQQIGSTLEVHEYVGAQREGH
ncbi:uncharacterized protein EI97DRAFT_467386 [Westerdykella ornata]|uniref:Phospholipase/carboxylesterase/thioesterase domain-containing protein n=1 Tax=Westerdykella ornata TaxID=318751 RepID=A0A6A6JKD3_WESOR|nr:uncharacterized protein EI97DRAFT_467386 [Westerdykella ornata]KAF2276156.1 hypothetical protein EI97DRAFT_467386 [Westerdykella ornata]